MATHTTLASLFTAIADAIRAKTGSAEPIVADDFPTAISNISAGSNKSTFTIEDIAQLGLPTITFEFELGMTWQAFINSSYNHDLEGTGAVLSTDQSNKIRLQEFIISAGYSDPYHEPDPIKLIDCEGVYHFSF